MKNHEILFADEFYNRLESECFNCQTARFRLLIDDLVLQIKTKVKLKPYSIGSDDAVSLIEANIYRFKFHLQRSIVIFSDDSSYPFLKDNYKIFRNAIEGLIRFLEIEIGYKTPNHYTLINFCAALFIILTNNGIVLNSPGKGRNVKDNDFKIFGDFCRNIINGEEYMSILKSFKSEDLEEKILINDLQTILINASNRMPVISSSSEIHKFVKKKFGYTSLSIEGLIKKNDSISALLQGTSCEGFTPNESISYTVDRIKSS